MKCNHCGYVNPNHIESCMKCGKAMPQPDNNIPNQNISQQNNTNNLDSNINQPSQNNNQQNLPQNNSKNYQQYNNQSNGQTVHKPKNMILALILGFLINGLGHAYDGLYTRAIIFFVIKIIFSLLGSYVSGIFSLIGIIWTLYSLYDVYLCTKAINEGTPIPKLLNQYEIE